MSGGHILTMAEKMRVLFLIDSLKMGGAERITVALLPHFTDITPVICTLHDEDSPLLAGLSGMESYSVHAKKLLDREAIRRLFALVATLRIDVIHAQLQHATILAALLGRHLGIPVVTTRHVMVDTITKPRERLIVGMERLATRYGVDTVIYVSQAALEAHRQQANLGSVTREVIYNGIGMDAFTEIPRSETQHLREKLGFPADKPIVTMVGVMRPGKGHSVLLDAAKGLPDHHFVLVGDGDAQFSKAIIAQATALSNVQLLGKRMDIPDILAASDIFVLPSDNEALPTVLIEAGAAALPVIATRVGGIAEIIEEGETGLLIEVQNPGQLADAIRQLTQAPERARSMGEAARCSVSERFSIGRQVDLLTELYQRVMRAEASHPSIQLKVVR